MAEHTMTQRELTDLLDALDGVKEKLEEAVAAAEDAARMARTSGAPSWVHGQLKSYLIGNVQAFIDGYRQIGSIDSIREGLEREVDELKARAKEEEDED
ncbi:MAG: hypothetical protein HY680_10530 [Chloroflexi bacterium]|nr:hypothetical protein [Chloroflexota bacterium]